MDALKQFAKEANVSTVIGDIIYELMGNDTSYDPFILGQIKKRYLSLFVNEYLSYHNDTYNILKEHGHVGEDNRYTYGDIDHSIWIEENNTDKIIVSQSHCSERQHLFILRNPVPDYMTFMCVTFEDEEVKPKNFWKDHRDWDKFSLQTYRDHDFKFGYEDCRDYNHVFKYEQLFRRLESVHTENEILFALWQMKWDNEMISNYEENKC